MLFAGCKDTIIFWIFNKFSTIFSTPRFGDSRRPAPPGGTGHAGGRFQIDAVQGPGVRPGTLGGCFQTRSRFFSKEFGLTDAG